MPRAGALLQALLVTFLWSSSWVLIKVGLQELPAITFAGLRYGLATLVLLPFFLRAGGLAAVRDLTPRARGELAALGLTLYALTQGAQFAALALLPAASASLVLSFTPVVVALMATAALREASSGLQWLGIGIALVGALVFFGPTALPTGYRLGLAIAAIGLLANAAASVLGRAVNRRAHLSPIVVTTASMALGAAVLLTAGVTVQGLPALSATSWVIVAWLAVVNTAGAFVLWNHTLRRLSATESSAVNNTMLVQVSLLALLFLGEPLGAPQWAGIVLVTLGTLLVQLRGRFARRQSPQRTAP